VTGPESPPLPPAALAAALARGGGLSARASVLIGGLLVVGAVVAIPVIMLPKMLEPSRITLCRSNLGELSQIHVRRTMEDRGAAERWSGSSLWLAMRRDRRDIGVGRERVLLCDGDGCADVPSATDDLSAWDEVDLQNPARELCSYAGRDFATLPIDPDDETPHPIGACVHHRDGAVVAFDDGTVSFMERAELGLTPDDDIVCGPESKSPILRVLRGGE
jgi:hypothetical protein